MSGRLRNQYATSKFETARALQCDLVADKQVLETLPEEDWIGT